MSDESSAAISDMVVLPGVLGCWTLRRTVQVRLGSNTLWLPGGTPISKVSRRRFVKHPDIRTGLFFCLIILVFTKLLEKNTQTKEVIKVAKKKKDDCGCGCLPLKRKGSSELKPEAKKSKKSKR
jgi:hypothetical protein